jgi:drug/metabolite transporter (DMT)-like permease
MEGEVLALYLEFSPIALLEYRIDTKQIFVKNNSSLHIGDGPGNKGNVFYYFIHVRSRGGGRLSLTSIVLILFSCLCHSYWNILTRSSANSLFFSGLKGTCIVCLGALFFLDYNFQMMDFALIFWATLSGVLHGFYIFCLSRAYRSEDISYVYPIARSAPVFVPLFAFLLLGERLAPNALLAVVMIVFAVYLLHFDGNWTQGWSNLYQAILHKDLRWAYWTLGMVVAYSLVDKMGMDHFFMLSPESGFKNGAAFFFMESVVCFALYNVYLFKTYEQSEIMTLWKNEWRKGLLGAIATLGSYGLICGVLQFEEVSAVVSLRQISVCMVIYWGCWVKQEPFGRERMTAGLLIVAGVVLMAW